jgi:hypothetical protein
VGHIEGWALQYNQHLGKTLLVPVEEPKPLMEEIIKETIRKNLQDVVKPEVTPKRGNSEDEHIFCEICIQMNFFMNGSDFYLIELECLRWYLVHTQLCDSLEYMLL